MLNFELCTETERREAAAIERRRAQDEERKKRIFGPKAKIFIDHAALDIQIQEKKKRDEEERQRNAVFEEQARQYDILTKELEEKEALERKKLQQEINDFRLNFQIKGPRREEDLLQKSLVTMLDDDNKFEGEDLYGKERRKIQAEQTRVWLDQQMDEKERADRERRDAEEAYREATYARDQQARELDKLEEECRQRVSLACNDYNKALADERDRKRRLHRREEEQDVLAHKYNVMMSDMLLETSDGTSATKLKGKGMSRADRIALLEEQKALAQAAKERKELEKRRDAEFNEYSSQLSQTIAAIDTDLNLKKLEANRNIAEENLRLGKEQRKKEQFLKKVVYTNRPTEEFYEQFNKTAR